MIEDQNRPPGARSAVAANDNGAADAKLDAAVLTLARLIGRQIAREDFERPSAANDNRQTDDGQESR